MDSIAVLHQVSKRYGPHRVLDAFTLHVTRGEMLAITGPSGAGKSTVLNILGLLEPPDHGQVELFGRRPILAGSRLARTMLRTQLAYLFQNYALVDEATVDANLDIALMGQRLTRAEQRHRKLAALDQVGLSVSFTQKVYTLSGGEQQRVALARILLKPCELVLADEPTGSLDDGNRDRIIRLLQAINDTGKTVVIVTHTPEMVAICHRSIVLPGEIG